MPSRMYAIKDSNQNNKTNKFFYMKNIIIDYPINKYELEKRITNIFTKYCGVSIIGYNKSNDKYYIKIFKNNKYELHIEIKLQYEEDNVSKIKFMPIICNSFNIQKLLFDIDRAINNYYTL
jgi:hypothetical protein